MLVVARRRRAPRWSPPLTTVSRVTIRAQSIAIHRQRPLTDSLASFSPFEGWNPPPSSVHAVGLSRGGPALSLLDGVFDFKGVNIHFSISAKINLIIDFVFSGGYSGGSRNHVKPNFRASERERERDKRKAFRPEGEIIGRWISLRSTRGHRRQIATRNQRSLPTTSSIAHYGR